MGRQISGEPNTWHKDTYRKRKVKKEEENAFFLYAVDTPPRHASNMNLLLQIHAKWLDIGVPKISVDQGSSKKKFLGFFHDVVGMGKGEKGGRTFAKTLLLSSASVKRQIPGLISAVSILATTSLVSVSCGIRSLGSAGQCGRSRPRPRYPTPSSGAASQVNHTALVRDGPDTTIRC